ncbi:MAG: hypothetical protein K940chlam9_01715 [Chlamydiae bacterium]|nr:hypothetical protein [Chlamydiota bacterium]
MKRLLVLLAILLHPVLCQAITVTSPITDISGTGAQASPLLAISDEQGRAAAVWTENFPIRVEVAYFNGMNWQPSVRLGTGSFPNIDIDGSGNATVIWLDTATNQILTSRYSVSSGAFSPPLQISASNVGGVNAAPKIAVNSHGHAIAVWVLGSPLQLIASTCDPSTNTWSSPVTLVTGVGSFPQVALDNNNNGIVLWTSPQFGIESITISIP